MIDRDKLAEIGRAAVKATVAELELNGGGGSAVIVITRELPDGKLNLATNVVGDRAALGRILEEARGAVGDRVLVM
jgi:hypothetical protein